MRYRLYKRQAKKGYIWWYSWRDAHGKRHMKSTGCRSRSEAEDYLEGLKTYDNPANVTVREYGADFYTDRCSWVKRQREKGRSMSEGWLEARRSHLTKHILPQYGSTPIQDLNPIEVENWLLTKNLANHTRNQIMYSLTIMVSEANREGVVKFDPLANIEPFRRKQKSERDMFNDDDIEKLFPRDRKRFLLVWPEIWDGVMSATALSAGLRSGEVRSLQWFDIAWDKRGILVQRALDMKMQIVPPKGREYRAVPVPQRTMDLLTWWMDETHYDAINDYVFADPDGEPWTRYVALGHLRKAIGRAGIEKGERSLGFHSLRHTFNTKMRMKLPDIELRKLTGHKDERMTEHYDHAALTEKLELLEVHRPAIETFWDQKEPKSRISQ